MAAGSSPTTARSLLLGPLYAVCKDMKCHFRNKWLGLLRPLHSWQISQLTWNNQMLKCKSNIKSQNSKVGIYLQWINTFTCRWWLSLRLCSGAQPESLLSSTIAAELLLHTNLIIPTIVKENTFRFPPSRLHKIQGSNIQQCHQLYWHVNTDIIFYVWRTPPRIVFIT